MQRRKLIKKINTKSSTEKEKSNDDRKKLWMPERHTQIVPELSIEDMLVNSMLPVEEFSRTEMPNRKMILFPWLLTKTITLITAERGVGKTWLSLIIAMAVTRQVPIGEWYPENPAKCFYVDGEMASTQLKNRIDDFVINLPEEKAPLYVVSSDLMKSKMQRHTNIADPEWRESITNIITDTGFSVLILDNIASLAPGLNENVKKCWDPINQWLLELRANDVAVIMIHHAGKKKGQRGTSAREDNIDNSIYLSRPSDYAIEQGARFNVEFTKARAYLGKAGEPFCLHVKKSGNGLIWTTETPKPELKHFIIALLGLKVPKNEITKMLRCDEHEIMQVMKRAMMKGVIDKHCNFIGEGINLYDGFTVEEVLEEFNS